MATTFEVPIAASRSGVAQFPKPFVGSVVLFVSDAAALFTAIVLGSSIWAVLKPGPGSMDLRGAYFLAIGAVLMAYAAQGLYGGFALAETEQLRRIAGATTFVYLTLTAALFLSKEGTSQSRGAFVCSWVLSVILVPLLRAAVIARVSRRAWWGRPAVIVGAGALTESLLMLFRSEPALGIRPVAVIDDSDASHIAGVPVFPDIDTAEAYADRLHLCHAVVVEPGADAQALLDRCAERFANVLIIPQLGVRTSLWISPRDLGGTLGLEIRHNLLIPFNRWLKRLLDLAVVAGAGLVAAPIVAISAAWICIVSPGSPFFAQKRQASRGRCITVYKLRTMYPDAEMMLLQFLARSDDVRAEWERYFKLKNDPRVLPGIGRFLRRTSLDELPQLWNILKGQMSIVGPRPIVNDEIERYGNSFDLVQRVKPGLTGLWQVSGRNDVSYAERVRLDSYYVRNWSIWLDITIIAKTSAVVLFRKGAY